MPELPKQDKSREKETLLLEAHIKTYMNEDHEIKSEIDDHKCKLIIRLKVEDFIPHMESYDPKMTPDFILKNPINYSVRTLASKPKFITPLGSTPFSRTSNEFLFPPRKPNYVGSPLVMPE